MSQLNVTKSGAGLSVTYTYGLRSSAAENTGPLEQEYTVTPNPEFIRSLCKEIDEIITRAQGGVDMTSDLARNGKLLYNTLFPSAQVSIPDLARRVHGEDPLLICSNEAEIPWELLHNGEQFLSLKHNLGRKTFVGVQVVRGRVVRTLKRALIVGDPLGDLAAAREEAENVASWLRGQGTECTSLLGAEASLLKLVQTLDEGEYDLFHYSGHVDTPYGTRNTGLRLYEDQLLDERALQPLSTKGVPPVVFINGCASAGQLNNLCVAFMITGAKVVMGTRYKIGEESARQFAECFYATMLAGGSAGAAVRAARQSLAQAGSIDWASFVLYGDPSAVITSPATSPGTGESDKPSETAPDQAEPGYSLDPQSSALMQRLVRQAAQHGIATSLDLLTELIPTREFRGRVAGTAGSANLSVLQQLLSAVQDATPPGPLPADTALELSGTVQSVLVRATRRVQESGRELITIDDLVDAFFAVGGGHSREILELVGISIPGQSGDQGAGQRVRQGAADGIRIMRSLKIPDASPPDNRRQPMTTDSGYGPPFGVDGYLHQDSLAPAAVSALLIACLRAATQQSVVGTNMLLTAFALANSTALRDALADQGAAGEAAFRQLRSDAVMSQRLFSSRTKNALRRAADAAGAQIDDSAVLRELLAEEDSRARDLLSKLHVDPDQVVRSLANSDHGADPE